MAIIMAILMAITGNNNCHTGDNKGIIIATLPMIMVIMAMIMATLAIRLAIMAIIVAIHGP